MTRPRSSDRPAGELLQLEAEEAAVGAELHDVVGDLVLDPAHHLEALEDVRDVADGDEVLDLERREGAGDLVEARLVALEGLQRLVGPRQDRAGVLEHDAATGDVEGDDAHRLAHRHDREPGLLRDPLGGAVARARLARLDPGVGDELRGRAQDAGDVAVADDAAVHLRELAQAGGRELDVEREAAGRDRLDHLVVAEHDEGAGASAQDALEAVAQLGARGDGRERGTQELVVGGCTHA